MKRFAFLLIVALLVSASAVAQEVQKLVAFDTAEGDHFGWCVAVDDDTAVIGAFDADDSFGAAYVFTRSNGVWAEQQKLTASDGVEFDMLGWSVSVDGDTAVIGAATANNTTGSVYVFTRSNGIWTEQQKLTASDAAGVDFFGAAVAVDGDTAVIGAYWQDDYGVLTGAAYVFTRSNGVWTEQQKLLASDATGGDQFGRRVDVDGGTAVISAHAVGDSGPRSGAAYVFTRASGVWTEQQKLLASDGTGGDIFGNSVTVLGDTVVIGAPDSNLNGSAYVFTRSSGVWTEQQKLLASDGAAGDRFGYSVALSENTAVIGAHHGGEGGDDSGSAYVFGYSNGVWTEQQKLLASDGAEGDGLGWFVAVSGDTALTGAHGVDDNGTFSGAAYVFEITRSVTDSLNDLVSGVLSLNIQNGVASSFDAKLQTVIQALDDLNENNDVAAVNALWAFIHAVEAQRGKRLTSAQADALIADAQEIIDRLSNGG